MKNFAADVENVWNIYNSAWERNWGFIPMSKEEFQLQGKEMKQILKPELVLIGEVEGRVVGFALALPDINQALKPAQGWILLSPGIKRFLVAVAFAVLVNLDLAGALLASWGLPFLAHALNFLGMHPPTWLRIASLGLAGVL